MTLRELARPGATPRPVSVDAAHALLTGPVLISTQPPGPTQRALARVVTGALFAAFLLAFAFRDTQLARLDSFIPVANTVVGLNDFLTACLLYAQYSVTRARALLFLASGFLFKTLILIPHAVTFPGVFALNGLLNGRFQSTTWLFPLQQFAFGLSAVAYTILRDRDRTEAIDEHAVGGRIAATVTLTVTAAVLATWILFAEDAHLPRLVAADAVHVSDDFRRVTVRLLIGMGVAATIILWRRPKTMIDLWLQVAVWSWVFEAVLTTLVTARFGLIFYANRVMGMISSSFMLLVLLSESLMLHRRLVLTTASRAQEREDHYTTMDVMLASLAHELRQPLTAILINGRAGAALLSRTPKDVEEARAALRDISDSVLRANEIIDSVRTMFAPSDDDHVALATNDLVRESVVLMHADLEANGIALDLDLSHDLPLIRGRRGQLVQVLMNGVKNAIESLATVSGRARELRIRTERIAPDGVAIRIEDSGHGLDPAASDRIFEPFYSTKPRGTGLGLSICQSIVASHSGTLSLLPRLPHGAIFQVELPAFTTLDESREISLPSTPARLPRRRRDAAVRSVAG